MLLEEGAEEEGQVLDEVLLVVLSVLVGLSDVSHQWQHLQDSPLNNDCLGCAVLLCLVCLFDLVRFFVLPSPLSCICSIVHLIMLHTCM